MVDHAQGSSLLDDILATRFDSSAAALGEAHDYLCVRQGKRAYAISARQVTEVIPPQTITVVPRAPSHILGVVSRRGQALPVFDMASYFGEEKLASPRRVVVASASDLVAGIPVDEVIGLRSYSEEQIRPPLSVMQKLGNFCTGHVADGDLLIWVVDAAKLLESARSTRSAT